MSNLMKIYNGLDILRKYDVSAGIAVPKGCIDVHVPIWRVSGDDVSRLNYYEWYWDDDLEAWSFVF